MYSSQHLKGEIRVDISLCAFLWFFFFSLSLYFAADGTENLFLPSSGFKPGGRLQTWLIWRDCHTCASLIKYAAETKGWICKAAWEKKNQSDWWDRAFSRGAGWRAAAAWQQRCRDRDKNAKGGANDVPKDLVLIKIRLSAYNETFGKKEAEIIVWC